VAVTARGSMASGGSLGLLLAGELFFVRMGTGNISAEDLRTEARKIAVEQVVADVESGSAGRS
jgi:hypothetical protein